MTENQKMALMAIADHLEHQVTDAQFRMNRWMEPCGTVGCAIGHTIHLLPGLELVRRNTRQGFMPRHLRTGRTGYRAIAEEFGLNLTEVGWLFSPYDQEKAYTDRTVVLTRIRAFAKGEVRP